MVVPFLLEKLRNSSGISVVSELLVGRIFNCSHINGGILDLFWKFTIQELYSCVWLQKENILIYIYLGISDLF